MHTIRRSTDRGYADHGWLKSFHSFSFANYHDPAWMGFGNLRVINEDRIAPATGFGRHGHKNMEIVSFVLSGALGHQDSMGNTSVILPGQIQRMSAGTGVEHSEMNRADQAATHFFQIWLLPNAYNIAPEYEQTPLDLTACKGQLALVAEPKSSALATPTPGKVQLNADTRLWYGEFDATQSGQWETTTPRLSYLHLISGSCEVDGQRLNGGDAALVRTPGMHRIERCEAARVLVFDLAP